MSLVAKTVLGLLVFLAVSSGVTKIMLMPQDVEFFANYGFTGPMIIVFGAVQLIAGLLMIVPKLRMTGAIAIAVTFLLSTALLVMDGNYPVAAITVVMIVLLFWVARTSRSSRA